MIGLMVEFQKILQIQLVVIYPKLVDLQKKTRAEILQGEEYVDFFTLEQVTVVEETLEKH